MILIKPNDPLFATRRELYLVRLDEADEGK